MQKIFKLEGLDCANCAAELERKIAKIKGVTEVNINFFMQKMELTYDENNEDILKKVLKVIKKEEPDVEIEEI